MLNLKDNTKVNWWTRKKHKLLFPNFEHHVGVSLILKKYYILWYFVLASLKFLTLFNFRFSINMRSKSLLQKRVNRNDAVW